MLNFLIKMIVIKDNRFFKYDYSHISLYEGYNITCPCLVDYYTSRLKREGYDVRKYEDLGKITKESVDTLIQNNPKLKAVHREMQLEKLLCNH